MSLEWTRECALCEDFVYQRVFVDARWYYLAFKFDVLWFPTATDKYVVEVLTLLNIHIGTLTPCVEEVHGGVVLVGFKPYLQDQLVSFSALTLLVWSYDL